MKFNKEHNRTILVSVIVLLSFGGCEKMGNEPPTAIDIQPGEKSSFTKSLSSTPDIIVNTTSDVSDFGGSQQVTDLPGPDEMVSLREAIIAANNTAGANVIGFNIPSSDGGFDGSVFTFKPLSALPPIRDNNTIIDGSSQSVITGNTNPAGPELVLSGSLMQQPARGFVIEDCSQCQIHCFVVNGFSGPMGDATDILPVGIGGGGENKITGCFIGIDPSGTSVIGGVTSGLSINVSESNIIGGSTAVERNVIAGFTYGIQIESSSKNRIEGNFLGTDVTGTAALGNLYGVLCKGTYNEFSNNLISGSIDVGIFVSGDGNIFSGNFIGTDQYGQASLPNSANGLLIVGDVEFTSDKNIIKNNVISGNSAVGLGILSSNDNIIEGNLIGTNASGTAAIPNAFGGISIQPGPAGNVSARNQIGGLTPGSGNLISGNSNRGLIIHYGEYNQVQGNFIGTNKTGSEAIGNAEQGILIVSGSHNLIGGEAQGAGNLISGNAYIGIEIGGEGAEQNIIQGNLIGMDKNGTKAIGNLRGVSLGSNGNLVGGSLPGMRNFISGNTGMGVFILSPDNIIQGNYIGTDKTGMLPVPNGTHGIAMTLRCDNNTIGGNAPGEGNLIAFNADAGIVIASKVGVNNQISCNRIHSNGALGIDLATGSLNGDGTTLNDPGDIDTGSNNLMNYPVLESAEVTPGKLFVRGYIDTPNPKTVTIEFFANPVPDPGGDPSGYGEGAIYLGSDRPNLQGKFTATLPTVTPGTLITVTATDAEGNTSEFAANIEAKILGRW